MGRDDLEKLALRALSALAVGKAFRVLAPFVKADDIVSDEAGEGKALSGAVREW